MTVSANATPDFQRDQIISAAYGICGLIPSGSYPKPDQMARGAVHFALALQEIQLDATLTTQVRTTLPLLTSQAEYTLDSDTLDVIVDSDGNIGSIISPVTGDPETIVKSMPAAEYQKVATKLTTSSRPSRCFIDKSGTALKAVFWPVPDSSNITFRYTKERLLRDCDTGASTLELKRVWAPVLLHLVAIGVARDNSKFELARDFRTDANALLAKAQKKDVEHGTIQMRVGHSGRNW